jgi:alkanesulfonate monooxygenase SsuD/methylene tetrahydromethanopterin reductase-like flavin-dependent oxidoreductase (luciferase family)
LYVENLHPGEDDLDVRLQEHREQVALARQAGFRSIVLGHHVLTHPIQMLAPIPHMASLIAESGDMQIAAGVLLLPLLNPILLAEDLASLDWLSGGRVVFGVGLGYRDVEYQALDVKRTERVKRFTEVLDAVLAQWNANGTWSFHGDYFKYDDLPVGLKPKQQPHPPLWFAADVEKAVQRAGRYGAAWYISPRARMETIASMLPLYTASLAEHGHKMPAVFPMRREAFLAPTEKEAKEMAVVYLQRQLLLYQSWGQYKGMPDAAQSDITFTADQIPDTYLVGTPDRVAELIEKYAETLGINHIVLRMQWPGTPHELVMRSIDMVGSKLVPNFSRAT